VSDADTDPPERQRRQARDRAHGVDRRRVSRESKRRGAEAIHHDDPAAALEVLFEVLTGDTVADHPPVRDVVGQVRLGDGVALADDRTLVVAVTVGGRAARAFVDGESPADTYRIGEVAEGTHDIGAAAVEVRETDPETLASTRYAVEASLSVASATVTVDTTAVPIGDAVSGAAVAVESLSVGAEITEDS
jgi:hypothetical protein